MMVNQVCSLILEERIQTSIAKAKEARRIAERMVTLGKKGSLHHRRRAIAKLHNTTAVRKLFAEIAPRFRQRPGGYTRIIRLGHRRGDATAMCFLEWVEEGYEAPIAGKSKDEPEADEADEAPEAQAEEVAEAAETADAPEAQAEEAASEEPAEAGDGEDEKEEKKDS